MKAEKPNECRMLTPRQTVLMTALLVFIAGVVTAQHVLSRQRDSYFGDTGSPTDK